MEGRHREKTGISEPRRESAEETHSADTWALDFGPPGLWEHKLLLFKLSWSAVLCYGSWSKVTQPKSRDWTRQYWVLIPIGILALHVFLASWQPLSHFSALPCTDLLTGQKMQMEQTSLSHFRTRSRQAESPTHLQRSSVVTPTYLESYKAEKKKTEY